MLCVRSHLLPTNIGKLVSLARCSCSLVLAGLIPLFLFGALFTGSESTVIGTIQDKNILLDTNKLTKSVLYCSCFVHFLKNSTIIIHYFMRALY